MTRQNELNLIDEMTRKLAQLKLAEQSINDLTSTCRKQAAQIAALVALVGALNTAVCHIERMNETAPDRTMTPESELKNMRAALEAAEGKQVTK
jgi:hypothetical protein